MASIRKRTNTKGQTVYQVQVRVTGHPPKTRAFDRKKDGENWGKRTEAELQRMGQRSTLASSQTSLSEIVARYREQVTPSHSDVEAETYRLLAWESHHPLKDRPLDQITSMEVARWRDERLQIVAPGTVVRELNVLHAIIEQARDEWGLHLPENPVSRVRRPKVNDQRERRLRPDEEVYLLRAMRESPAGGPQKGRGGPIRSVRSPWLEPFFRFALETAMRRGEQRSLRWPYVDFTQRIVRVHQTKNGEPRSVPLSSQALAILQDLPEHEDPDRRVFPISDEAIKNAWGRTKRRGRQIYEADCKAAGEHPDPSFLEDLPWHDLRHEATSRFFEQRFQIMEVASITGHKDLRMLKRYTHMDAARLAERMK